MPANRKFTDDEDTEGQSGVLRRAVPEDEDLGKASSRRRVTEDDDTEGQSSVMRRALPEDEETGPSGAVQRR
jgi:hypothetical protein